MRKWRHGDFSVCAWRAFSRPDRSGHPSDTPFELLLGLLFSHLCSLFVYIGVTHDYVSCVPTPFSFYSVRLLLIFRVYASIGLAALSCKSPALFFRSFWALSS